MRRAGATVVEYGQDVDLMGNEIGQDEGTTLLQNVSVALQVTA